MKNAGTLDKETKKYIADVVGKCITCRRYMKTKDNPKVGMPKAGDTNEVVSLDLKEMSDDDKYILYLVDEFSRFTRAEVLPSKEAPVVLKALEDSWVHRGPSWPSRGFFSDRGGEFDNKDMQEYARKVGITLRMTPSYSPWANGGNERNHYTVDRTIAKVRLDDPTISLEEAVHKSCFWKNAEINKSGYSPQQLMYGKGTVLPGINDGNVATDEPCTDSKIAHQIISRHMNVRDAARIADNSARIKKMLKTRIPDYVDRFYKEGDRVFIKN